MAIFVQVIGAKVHWRFVADTNPYAGTGADLDIRNVTSVSPSPQEGWIANVDGTYSAPVVPPAIDVARGVADYKATVRAKATRLLKANDVAGALILLQKIGE